MSRARLARELFADADPVIAETVSEWLAGSRHFAAFVAENLPKVRKKLRTPRDAHSTAEVLFELDIAYRLLRDKSFGLVYEPLASSKVAGPDFAVSYNGRPWLLLEVTRLSQAGADQLEARLARAVAGKLRQCRAGEPNVLLVGSEHPQQGSAVAGVLAGLARSAESADNGFFNRMGLRDRSAFFRHLGRLSLVLVTGVGTSKGEGVEMWANPRAQRPLENPGPATFERALLASLS